MAGPMNAGSVAATTKENWAEDPKKKKKSDDPMANMVANAMSKKK